jgi:hypothetical protein
MIVFCEECGERYVIEPETITGPVITFACKVCKDIIQISVNEQIGKRPTNSEEAVN